MKFLFILLGISSGCFSSQYLMASRPNVCGMFVYQGRIQDFLKGGSNVEKGGS